jgi:hypothetical protein
MPGEADFVSDLNDGTADVISANVGSVDPHRGSDPVSVPAEKPAPAPKAAPSDEPAPKPLTLREQLSSAIKGETNTPAPALQDGGIVRNPDGTFAPKEAADTPEAAPPVAAAVPVPPGLSAAEAEHFTKLPAELQQSVARTMDYVNQQAQRYQSLGQVEGIIGPRRQAWAMAGMTDAQVVNQLFALSDFAEKDPAGFVSYFAQQRGIDLEEIVFGAEPVDPNVQALQQQVQNLQQQLGGMTTQQQQAAHNSTVNEVIEFAKATDANGKPLRPYFEELGSEVMPFITAVMQQNPQMSRTQVLQEAYDRASWGNPSVRAKMQAAADAARDAARIKEQQDTAKRARTAGSSVPAGVPASENPAAVSGNRSLRDDLRAAIAQHS